ncbi:MAG: hypothetical protein IJR00_07235 [Lachnospiraceae bacterium]|nr:hypothetical protein [Lachnospiraceae bacterium]
MKAAFKKLIIIGGLLGLLVGCAKNMDGKMSGDKIFISEITGIEKSHLIMSNPLLEAEAELMVNEDFLLVSIDINDTHDAIAATVDDEEWCLVEYNLMTDEVKYLLSREELVRACEERGIEQDFEAPWRVEYRPGGGISFYYCMNLWLYNEEDGLSLVDTFPRGFYAPNPPYRWLDETRMYLSTDHGAFAILDINTGEIKELFQSQNDMCFEFEVTSKGDVLYNVDGVAWYYYDIEKNTERLICKSGYVDHAHALSPDDKKLIYQELGRGMTSANTYTLCRIDIEEGNAEIIRNNNPYAAFGMIWIDDYAKE